MFQILNLNNNLLIEICDFIPRNYLPYHEYKFLSEPLLKKHFEKKTLEILGKEKSLSFVIFDNSEIKGLINISKDNFDSGIFGFNCYKISDLFVFSSDFTETELVVNKLLEKVDKTLTNWSNNYYLFYSLNNNLKNAMEIFNCIVKNRFNYIHTLLTFSSVRYSAEIKSYYPELGILIREANINDVNEVADLSYKSFKYSRFFMDPTLDKSKSEILLKTSAENSILNKLADIIYVAECNGKIVGYYSGKKKMIPELNQTIGEAIISVIDEKSRGMGIFSALDNHLLNWFSKNTDFAEMGTYFANKAIHKTWIGKNLNLVRGSHQFSIMQRK
jgi:hypothetical protein